MVSVLGNQKKTSAGCYNFNSDHPCDNETMDDTSLVSTVLSADEEPHTYKLPTTGVIVLEIICIIGLLATSFAFTFDPSAVNHDKCLYMNSLHIAIWLLFIIGHYYLRHKHRKLLLYGYMEFYRKSINIRKLPVMIVSAGNAVLLFLLSLPYHYCEQTESCKIGGLLCCHYILIVVGIETAILLPTLVYYCIITIRFNQEMASPDVHNDELSSACFSSQIPFGEIGYRDESYVEEILEKQSDMVYYLKQHITHLSKKILKLMAEINTLKETRTQHV